jgi:hypothetical protein
MVQHKEIIIQEVLVLGYSNSQQRVIPLRNVDYEMFTSQGIAIIDGLIREHWDRSGTEMADLTHGIAWKVADLSHPIPYEASIISDEDLTQEDLDILDEIAVTYGISPG